MTKKLTILTLVIGGLAVSILGLCVPTFAATSEELERVLLGLSSSDPQTVEQAEGELRDLWADLWMRDIGPELPHLAELLRSDRAEVRQYAALTLAGAAANNVESARSLQSISSTLVGALGDPDPEVQRAVAATVAQMRPSPPPEATASLLDLLDASKEETRAAALGALVRVRPVPEGLRDVLVEQVRERSSLEVYAIRALGGLRIDDPEVVALVADRLNSSDPSLRIETAQALSHWGSSSTPALPKLREIAADPAEDDTLRLLARVAVEQISADEAEP